MKLSFAQYELLALISDHSEIDGTYWHPSNNSQVLRPAIDTGWSHTLKRHVHVEGSGSAAALKALAKKGLIEFHPQYADLYWARVTEEGRLVADSESEHDAKQ